MIGKAKTNESLVATIAYNEKERVKEKAILFYSTNLVGDCIADFKTQMQDLQKCYKGYAKGLTIHAILSPSIEDGKKLNVVEWNKIANDYLTKMSFQNQQAIGFIHSDKEHRHLHLVINKVKETDFKLIPDSFIGKKSQFIADEIAKDMKLVRAMEIKQQNISKKLRETERQNLKLPPTVSEKTIGSKHFFKSVLENILKTKFINYADYFDALEKQNFKVHKYINKQTGVLRGYGLEKNGSKMDASVIGKQFSLQSIFGENAALNENAISENLLTPLKDSKKIKNLEFFLGKLNIPISSSLFGKIEMLENQNQYFLGIKNDGGGYFLFNSILQQNIGVSEITSIISNKSNPTTVVETFFDYLKVYDENENNSANYIILNSLSNIEKLNSKITQQQITNVIYNLGDILNTKVEIRLKETLNQNQTNNINSNFEYLQPQNVRKWKR